MCDGVDSELVIEQLMPGVDGEANGDPRVHHAMQRQEIRMLTEQGLHLRREVTDLKKEEGPRDNINNLLPQMNRYIIRLMYVPANGHAAADEHLEMALEEPTNIINHARNSNSTPLVARLSKCARSLHALWKEWEVGGKGQNPVRLWNGTDRGKHKATLYKKKILWAKVREMRFAGNSADQHVI